MDRTNKSSKHEKAPLFHIVKRSSLPVYQSLLIRLAAIVVALLFCGVLSYFLIDAEPTKLFSSMFEGSFGTKRRMWKLAKDIAILLCISLAVTPAFRMRFWNIGAEGQCLVSALAAVAVVVYTGEALSPTVLLIFMFAAAVLAGVVWAVIPAIFKAVYNTNETLFTLMMNYVATNLVTFFLMKWVPSGNTVLGELQIGHLPTIFKQKNINNDYLLIIIAVAVVTILLSVYFSYTKHGYEISVVGESQKTARYIGINVKKVIIRTLVLSGSICGIVGFLIVSGLDHSVTVDTIGGRGFTAIMVSWLAKFNPLMMIATSFLMVFLNQGAGQIQTDFNISDAYPNTIVGIILFFIIGCEFFINYKIIFRQKANNVKGDVQ